MGMIWLIITLLACCSIYIGNILCNNKHQQVGMLLILVGSFQLIIELILIL